LFDGCKERLPRLFLIWADGGYRGKLIAWVALNCLWLLEIVKRNDDVTGFQVLPRRWVVERTPSVTLKATPIVKRLRARMSNIGSVDLFGDGQRNAQARQTRKLIFQTRSKMLHLTFGSSQKYTFELTSVTKAL